VHGIADLPGVAVPESAGDERANQFVPHYFANYESRFQLPVVRPVVVETVRDAAGRLDVITDHGTWNTAAIVNATGPSASTIGGNRAGFAAARELRDLLRSAAA
jgi:cation diffusion facilitator CzcD-associated flavoprotein CzcO